MEVEVLSSPKSYFDLIIKVGSKGVYQRNLFFIFSLNWFIAGMLIMGTSFLFMNPSFDCEGHHLDIDKCQSTICSMSEDKWSSFLAEPYVQSLATEYGPYLCNRTNKLDAFRMVLYFGTLCGYTIFLFITDNYGRKTSIVIAWSVTMLGVTLLCFAQSMAMACIGLFFAGAGCESAIRISMTIFSEVVDYYKRQSYSIALEIAFGMSGVVIGVVYWVFKAWRIVTISFIAIPCLIELLLLIFYLEETPKFLVIKQGFHKAVVSLNRVGKINKNCTDLINYEDIEKVYAEEEVGGTRYNITITPYHLFKFKSLRMITIYTSLLFLLISYLYFGPMIIVDSLGVDPFMLQIFLSCSELLAYPISFWFIQKTPRIKSGYVLFGVAAILTAILIFVKPDPGCKGCDKAIFQAIIMFLFRFTVSFYFSIYFLYVTEIFPLRARGIGFGVASAAGAIGTSSGQYIFHKIQQEHINPMILFTAFSILCILILSQLKQTLDEPLQNQIEQIKQLKVLYKQNNNEMKSQFTQMQNEGELSGEREQQQIDD